MAERRLSGETPPGRLTSPPLVLDHSIQLNKTGLRFPQTLSLRSWESVGNQLIAIANSSTWWIADWLVYGEDAFQSRYIEAVKKTSLNYQTLRNYAWVARRFELPRRLESLSFCHHAEVAALERPEQDYWLHKAGQLRWSRNQLRQQVRASLKERHGGPPTADERLHVSGSEPAPHTTALSSGDTVNDLHLQLTASQLTRCSAAASGQDLRLHEWAVRALMTAAGG